MALDFLESTLEDIIYENQKVIHLRGFPKLISTIERQIYLASGKRVDLLSYDEEAKKVQVFELKKDNLRLSGVLQLLDYGAELMRAGYEVELFLIGKYVEEEIRVLCAWGLKVNLIEYKYGIDGISFRNPEHPWNDYAIKEWSHEDAYDDFSDKYENEPSLG